MPRIDEASTCLRMDVSQKYVYGVVKQRTAARLFVRDVVTGAPGFDRPLESPDVSILLHGQRLIMQRSDGCLTIYDVATGGSDPPRTVPLPGGNCSLFRPFALGASTIAVARSGALYRMHDAQEDASMLWPNPLGLDFIGAPRPLGPDEVGLIGVGPISKTPQLLRVRIADGEVSTSLLALEEDTVTCSVTGAGHAVFYVRHVMDGGIAVMGVEDEPRQLASLNASVNAEILGMDVVPWRGAKWLLLRYVAQSQDRHQSLALLHATTGEVAHADVSPHRDDKIQVVWETGRTWIVNLTEGRIKPLP